MRASKSMLLSGVGISPGLAIGEAYHYRNRFDRQLPIVSISVEQAASEWVRLKSAIERVSRDVHSAAAEVARLTNADLAGIFEAHQEMLRDPVALENLREEIAESLITAESAVQRVFHKWEDFFSGMTEEIHRQRAADLADLGRRLLQALADEDADDQPFPTDRIVVAERLLPSEAVKLRPSLARALIISQGGPGSHCALLTRAMGIPAVLEQSDLFHRIRTGDLVLVDGHSGAVVVNPDPSQVREYHTRRARLERRYADARAASVEPARTQDGDEVLVLANIASFEDAQSAVRNGADGVGLFRLEMFYMDRPTLPSEDELVAEMNQAASLFPETIFCVRLLDQGGDKRLPYLRCPSEPNPNLGRRGIRFLLAYPELFRSQLRAILRVAQDQDLYLLVPMVTHRAELLKVRSLVEEMARELALARLPKIGPMLETPAAVLGIRELLPASDFFSVGTNDLTQYIMAADRDNPLVAEYYQDLHPIIIDLIRQAADAAGEKLFGVCGELAGKEEGVPLLLNIGLRVVSVAPARIPWVKQAVRNYRTDSEATTQSLPP